MNTTSPAKHPTHVELKTRLDALRVKLHLGGMDAHDKFEALSHEVTRYGRKTSTAAKRIAQSLLDRIESLEAALIIHD